jgi:hypothetical protein
MQGAGDNVTAEHNRRAGEILPRQNDHAVGELPPQDGLWAGQ